MQYDLAPHVFAYGLDDFVTAVAEWIDANEFDHDLVVFQFARAIKGFFDTTKVTADQAHRAVVKALASGRAASPAWNVDLSSEDGTVAFHDAWERVRFPMGTDPVEAACGLAGEGKILTQVTRPGRYSRFLTVAALLQLQMQRKAIFLPVRKLGEHLPCELNTVSAWIRWARQDGVLIRTRAHAFRSEGESRAAEYVLGLHMWEKRTVANLASMLGVPVRDGDVAWIREQFRRRAA